VASWYQTSYRATFSTAAHQVCTLQRRDAPARSGVAPYSVLHHQVATANSLAFTGRLGQRQVTSADAHFSECCVAAPCPFTAAFSSIRCALPRSKALRNCGALKGCVSCLRISDAVALGAQGRAIGSPTSNTALVMQSGTFIVSAATRPARCALGRLGPTLVCGPLVRQLKPAGRSCAQAPRTRT
jgi:hypothetical protein